MQDGEKICRTRHYNQRKCRTIVQKAGRLATLQLVKSGMYVEQPSTVVEVPSKIPSYCCLCVADDFFHSSRPGDFDMTPTIYCSRCPLTNWTDKATKLRLFLDDLFQTSPMLWVSVLLTIFSSPVQRLSTALLKTVDVGQPYISFNL